jgi:hypothetical protein
MAQLAGLSVAEMRHAEAIAMQVAEHALERGDTLERALELAGDAGLAYVRKIQDQQSQEALEALNAPSNERAGKAMSRLENVTVYSVERLRNSRDGNPRYKLHTSEGTLTTQSDAACNYGLENRASDGGLPLDTPVTLLATDKARAVWGWEV